jgi:hypothetical protein
MVICSVPNRLRAGIRAWTEGRQSRFFKNTPCGLVIITERHRDAMVSTNEGRLLYGCIPSIRKRNATNFVRER